MVARRLALASAERWPGRRYYGVNTMDSRHTGYHWISVVIEILPRHHPFNCRSVHSSRRLSTFFTQRVKLQPLKRPSIVACLKSPSVSPAPTSCHVCFYLAVAFIFTLVATSAFMLTLVFSVTIVKFIAQVTASLLDCANEMDLTARQSHFKQRHVQISLLKLFALIFYTTPKGGVFSCGHLAYRRV